jgi:succinoglycan biosynthesis protein ExoA
VTPDRDLPRTSSAELEVAIVIPALNEADSIGALLDDCAAQTHPTSEVIIVDAGSTDGTAELLAEGSARWPALMVERIDGAFPGAARNAGIARASAPVVATLDSGTRIGPGWLAAMAHELAIAPDRRLVVGVSHVDATTPFEQAAGWCATRTSRPPSARRALHYRPGGRNGYCFTKRAWEAAQGYPPHLRWGEDKVFVDRMRNAGYETVVAHAAVSRWRPRSSLRELWLQYAGYGRGDALAGIDPQNELVTLAVYTTGAVLAAHALRGDRRAAVRLVLGACGYLGLFTAAAARNLKGVRALAWMPAVRGTADVAKLFGYLSGGAIRASQAPRGS